MLSLSLSFDQFASSSWETLPPFPFVVAEAQGSVVGNDLVVTGGFLYPSFSNLTNQTYAYRLGTAATGSGGSSSAWVRQDDHPYRNRVTHAPVAVVGATRKLYMCGGYSGGHPGPAIADCYVYDPTVAPSSSSSDQQWSIFPSLPQPRAGSGMVHDAASNSLIYAGGAIREILGSANATDEADAWRISLDDTGAAATGSGWTPIADFPYLGNHISSVSGTDELGNQRHYFLGGQRSEEECCSNIKSMYEYTVSTNAWAQRADMPFGRGHAATSTVPYGCGFLIVGGAINSSSSGARTLQSTNDISYYHIPTDAWSTLGTAPAYFKTPVCHVGPFDDHLYCTTGYGNKTWRRPLRLVLNGTTVTKAPATKAPTKAPITRKPTTKKPTTAPITKRPTTAAPATKAPTTKAPATKSPTIKAPATKAPTTKAPAPPPTRSPATEAPVLVLGTVPVNGGGNNNSSNTTAAENNNCALPCRGALLPGIRMRTTVFQLFCVDQCLPKLFLGAARLLGARCGPCH
jgi:hypothetical protein